MIRRVCTVLLLVLAFSAVAQAQTLSEGEIVVNQPKPVLVNSRLELMPRFGVTFNDPLITQFALGISAYFHITENIYAGATFEWFDFNDIGGPTDNYDSVIRNASAIPELAPITWVSSADVGWVPIHGKFSLFDAAIVYYDFFAVGGIGAIDSIGDPHIGGVLALGQRMFIEDWVGLTIEVRDRLYVEPLPSGDTFTNILTASFGVSFFIPPSFSYEQLEDRILDWE